MPETVTLDRFDRALLAEVQADTLTPARILAERVGLSESAVLRRLRRLRQAGVIVADVAVVHPAVLGTPLCLHVLVSLERETSDRLDASCAPCARARGAGGVVRHRRGRFRDRAAPAGMAEYEAFTRAVFHDDPNVRAFRTLVAMRQVIGV